MPGTEQVYRQYMDEVTSYNQKVARGRRAARADPQDPRFSEQAEFARQAKSLGLEEELAAREAQSSGSLERITQTLKDPAIRQEFTALPREQQMALQEEILGKVIIDPDFQAVLRTDRDKAVAALHDFRNTMPVPPGVPTPEQEALQGPGSGFEKTDLFPETPTQHGPGIGMLYNKVIDFAKTLLDPATLLDPETIVGGGVATRMLKARPAQALSAEAGGMKPPPALSVEPVKPASTPTEFPPAEPPKAFTRPPSGALPPELGEQRVSIQAAADVKNAAIEQVQALGQTDASTQGRRVMHQVVEALDKGLINVDRIPIILERSHLTMRDFADELLKTYSTAGKQLQQLSQIKKQLNVWAESNPDASDALKQLDAAIPDGTIWDSIKTAYHAVDDPRRALMVGQLATAVRNFFSQGMRYSVEVLDEGLAQLYKGESPAKAMEAGLQFVHSLTPSSRADLGKLLKEFPLHEEILRGNIAGELTIPQKFLRVLNTVNIAQEQFYRRATFDAVLKNELRAAGKDVATSLATPATIPESIITKATDEAMAVTFAAAPKAKTFGAALMQAYHAIPMLTTVNPYPRFWANAADFLSTHNPLGVLRLARKDAQGEFLGANPQRRAEILAEATTGTMMLAGAIGLQQAGTRGGKWYQIQVGDQQVDLRAYAPFSSYMFVADVLDMTAEMGGKVLDGKGLKQALVDSGRYTTSDVVQGVIGMNRIAGTGLIFTDMLTQGSMDRKLDMLAEFASQYIGSFTVPFRTLKDGVSAFSQEESKLRDVRNDLLGPAKGNIPGVSQTLPEKPSPIEPAIPQTEHPLLRQLSGLSVKTANVVGTEMDRLGIEFSVVRAATGQPAFDRAIDRETSKLVENVVKPYVASPGFQRITDPALKKFALESGLYYARTLATQRAKAANPELAKDVKIDAVPKRVRDLILSITGYDLGKAQENP
jgi:hypothetical protein